MMKRLEIIVENGQRLSWSALQGAGCVRHACQHKPAVCNCGINRLPTRTAGNGWAASPGRWRTLGHAEAGQAAQRRLGYLCSRRHPVEDNDLILPEFLEDAVDIQPVES